MNSKFKVFLKGITDVSPLMIPVVPFGIIFGVIGMDLGIGPYMTFGMSIIVFGGASQIVLLQLFSGGASSLIILSSVGAVNSRHLLYGAVLSEHLYGLKFIWKMKSGRTHVGELNSEGLFHGKGTLTHPDGKLEKGIWKDGKIIK